MDKTKVRELLVVREKPTSGKKIPIKMCRMKKIINLLICYSNLN